MNSIIDYFETISSLHRGLILVGGIALFWLIENAYPLFKFQYNKIEHAGINIFFTATTIVVNFVMAFILLLAADFAIQQNIGILQWLPSMNIWLYTIIG
ncbi:MAG: sterol desaturase, partial [Flavobacterium sp.]|nr:sterol desaturase [Flavobacterium sp.]